MGECLVSIIPSIWHLNSLNQEVELMNCDDHSKFIANNFNIQNNNLIKYRDEILMEVKNFMSQIKDSKVENEKKVVI